MAINAQPGQWVQVKVLRTPASAASVKTLHRVLAKDPVVSKEQERIKEAREIKSHRRGGRIWYDRPSRVRVTKVTSGASYRVYASLDVLRDLASVAKYVEVSPA